MRFLIEVNGFYHEQGKGTISGSESASDIAPGDAPYDWRSEKVMAVSQIKQIFKDANFKGKITFLVPTPFATRFLKMGREFSSLNVEVIDPPTKQTHASMTAKDLKVIKNVHVADADVPKGSNAPSSAITLSIGDDFKEA